MATASRLEGGESGASFAAFVGRLAGGDDDAGRDLVTRFSARLVGLARRRLSPRLRVKDDPEDVIQSVFRTFFRRLGGGEFELHTWDGLAGLLTLLTIRKCQRRARHHRAQRRDLRRERPLDGGAGLNGRDIVLVPDREPAPEEVATFADLVERLLASLEDRDREIIRSVIAGESVADIADRLGRTRRTVQRAVARAGQRLLANGLGE